MTDTEEKVEETVEKPLDVVTKATLLKKAGFPTIATILILALSSPGVYEFFLNNKDEEARIEAVKAQAATQVSYELLKAKTENLETQISTLRGDMKEMTNFMREVLLRQASINTGRGGGMMFSPANTPAPPAMPTIEPGINSAPLPEDLDSLVQKEIKEDLAE